MSVSYITAMGNFLPGNPIENDEMEAFLGLVNGQKSRVKDRILKQNGIVKRYYALDKEQRTLYQNAEMAAFALEQAVRRSEFSPKTIEMLTTATTQGDLPAPGFGSMVHAKSALGPCELASFQSICASSLMALQYAHHQIAMGSKQTAAVVASEFASRLFKGSRYESMGSKGISFDIEFLRWMLSDGAGALILAANKPERGLSLRIDWIEIKSWANEFPPCMYVGKSENGKEVNSWLDYATYEEAAADGAIYLRQNIRLLDQVVETGIAHYFDLIDQGKFSPDSIDFLCCHYSSEYFRQPILNWMQKGGGEIPSERWFTNLHTKGNTGAASIFIMLEELMYSGRLEPGNSILCMVPESGRCITAFAHLTVEQSNSSSKTYAIREVVPPALNLQDRPAAEWLVRQLSKTWVDFENALLQVPIVQKIHGGKLTLDDYKLLLHDLWQQVIDGSRWITRAASNFSIELFDFRSSFIGHANTEHRDYQILERNYLSVGGTRKKLEEGEKNVGSMALSNFMFQQASKLDPVDLLGAMFIIEGVGQRLAGFWGEMMKEQLGLKESQVSFFSYHGVADEEHFKNLEKALNHPKLDLPIAKRIAKTAKTVAMLYRMQLAELGNY